MEKLSETKIEDGLPDLMSGHAGAQILERRTKLRSSVTGRLNGPFSWRSQVFALVNTRRDGGALKEGDQDPDDICAGMVHSTAGFPPEKARG